MQHDLAKFNVPNSDVVHCYRNQTESKNNCNRRHFLQQCLHQNFNIFWTNVPNGSILRGATVAVTSEVRASAVSLLIVGSYTVKWFFDIRRGYLTEMCDLSRNDFTCIRTALRYVHDQIDVACVSTTWGTTRRGWIEMLKWRRSEIRICSFLY